MLSHLLGSFWRRLSRSKKTPAHVFPPLQAHVPRLLSFIFSFFVTRALVYDRYQSIKQGPQNLKRVPAPSVSPRRKGKGKERRKRRGKKKRGERKKKKRHEDAPGLLVPSAGLALLLIFYTCCMEHLNFSADVCRTGNMMRQRKRKRHFRKNRFSSLALSRCRCADDPAARVLFCKNVCSVPPCELSGAV